MQLPYIVEFTPKPTEASRFSQRAVLAFTSCQSATLVAAA